MNMVKMESYGLEPRNDEIKYTILPASVYIIFCILYRSLWVSYENVDIADHRILAGKLHQ